MKAGRIVIIVVGALLALVGFPTMIGGTGTVVGYAIQRDDDGFFRTGEVRLASPRSPSRRSGSTCKASQARLRRVRSSGRALFRLESVLNTALFAGVPGFVAKRLAPDEHGVYRGLYEWDDPALAEDHVRALWWVLALVSVPASVHLAVLPGIRRDDLLRDPHLAEATALDESRARWRLTKIKASTR